VDVGSEMALMLPSCFEGSALLLLLLLVMTGD
jgi:hypothetical protein